MVKCPHCGGEVEIDKADAARVLAKIVTPKRIEALRQNAKKPRPNARGKRGPHKPKGVWELAHDLPFEEKRRLIEALLAVPRPRPPGRPKASERRETVGDAFPGLES